MFNNTILASMNFSISAKNDVYGLELMTAKYIHDWAITPTSYRSSFLPG